MGKGKNVCVKYFSVYLCVSHFFHVLLLSHAYYKRPFNSSQAITQQLLKNQNKLTLP